ARLSRGMSRLFPFVVLLGRARKLPPFISKLYQGASLTRSAESIVIRLSRLAASPGPKRSWRISTRVSAMRIGVTSETVRSGESDLARTLQGRPIISSTISRLRVTIACAASVDDIDVVGSESALKFTSE